MVIFQVFKSRIVHVYSAYVVDFSNIFIFVNSSVDIDKETDESDKLLYNPQTDFEGKAVSTPQTGATNDKCLYEINIKRIHMRYSPKSQRISHDLPWYMMYGVKIHNELHKNPIPSQIMKYYFYHSHVLPRVFICYTIIFL